MANFLVNAPQFDAFCGIGIALLKEDTGNLLGANSVCKNEYALPILKLTLPMT